MITYTLKIIAVRRETEDAVTLCFKQPALKKVKYLAGQYLTLIFRINGRRYIRPYSFSSAPGVDEFLEITVKRVPNGLISNHINDIVKEGDSIEVMQPMGDFIYQTDKKFKCVYLWGVGSGITPLISLAKYILFTDPQVKVYLIYGNRTEDSTIFLSQIRVLKDRYPENFTVIYFYTRFAIKDNNPFLIQGRIDQQTAYSILNKNLGNVSAAHYICGPAGLKESVKNALGLDGFNAEHVFTEDFELTRDPRDFEFIHTQMVGLKFKGQNYDLEVVKGKSILEAALDANIELPYSCQTGSCSTCKATLVSGESKMIGLVREREDLGEREYLLCCTHPLSTGVHITID